MGFSRSWKSIGRSRRLQSANNHGKQLTSQATSGGGWADRESQSGLDL